MPLPSNIPPTSAAAEAELVMVAQSNPRAVDEVHDLFSQAAILGERAVGVVRLCVSTLALLRQVLFNRNELMSFTSPEWLTVSVLIGAVLLSIPSLRIPPGLRGSAVRRRLLFSITVDALLVFGGLIVGVMWPSGDFHGMLARPYFAVVFVNICVSGLRLSRSAAVYATLVNSLSVALLLAVDHARNADRILYRTEHVVYVFIMMVAAGTAGVLVADRTRALVLHAAARLLETGRVRARLGAYMAREVAEAALQEREMKMGGQRQDVAVLFSDLRGFTSYSERLEPEQLVAQLNAYLEAMVTAIQAEGGVVDKYIGDAIMAVFGAPRSRGDDAARALRAAARMQQALVAHNVARAAQGLPPLQQGIGLHYGPVVAGNVGTPEHAQYTIVGDTVNLASRLESMTKEQQVPVLISQALLDAAGPADIPAVVPCGTLKVRGRETAVHVFTLADSKGITPQA